MSNKHTSLEVILMEWNNNLQFREKFKKDPIQALKDANFEVSDEILAKIKAIVRKSEELDKRINK